MKSITVGLYREMLAYMKKQGEVDEEAKAIMLRYDAKVKSQHDEIKRRKNQGS